MTNKQQLQRWLSNNGNISHVIHITPMYGVQRMKEIFYKVNWGLCKSFLPNRFPNFKQSKDRFNFFVFPQLIPDRHYHLLVHSPRFVTKKRERNCVCFQSLNTCEICVRRRLEELFLEVNNRFKLTTHNEKGNFRINDIYDNTYDATQQIYVTRDLSNRMDLKIEDDFYVIPEF